MEDECAGFAMRDGMNGTNCTLLKQPLIHWDDGAEKSDCRAGIKVKIRPGSPRRVAFYFMLLTWTAWKPRPHPAQRRDHHLPPCAPFHTAAAAAAAAAAYVSRSLCEPTHGSQR